MNRTTIASLAAITLAVGVAIRIVSHDPSLPALPPTAPRSAAAKEPAQERSEEKDGVTVSVAPVSPTAFSVVLDTHSGSLDDDLAVAVVRYIGDAADRPLRWEGDPPGGHHREGTLVFAAADRGQGPVRLELSLAAGQYVFTWE